MAKAPSRRRCPTMCRIPSGPWRGSGRGHGQFGYERFRWSVMTGAARAPTAWRWIIRSALNGSPCSTSRPRWSTIADRQRIRHGYWHWFFLSSLIPTRDADRRIPESIFARNWPAASEPPAVNDRRPLPNTCAASAIRHDPRHLRGLSRRRDLRLPAWTKLTSASARTVCPLLVLWGRHGILLE